MPEIIVIPELKSMLMQWAAFIILFLVVKSKLYGPMTEFLKKRSEGIDQDITDARNKKEEAMALQREYQSKIEDAKQEAKNIVEASRKRGEELKDEIVVKAKEEANSLIDRAQTEIKREKEKAVEDMKTEMVEIAMMAASKVIDKSMDDSDHRAMINNVIDEVGESTWQN